MLITLIRLMGAWIALYGFFHGFYFAFLLEESANSGDVFMAFLPSIVSLVLGISFIICAPRIAGGRSGDHAVVIKDLLPSGLILLGVYWSGIGAFSAISNTPMILEMFDESRVHLLRGSMYWYALASFVQMSLGITLIIIGARMRVKQQPIEQTAISDR